MTTAANAAAKKRRAGVVDSAPPPPPQSTQPQKQTTGLTIFQVVAVFDQRITALEKAFAEFLETNSNKNTNTNTVPEDVNTIDQNNAPVTSNELNEEFSARYEMLAEEIDSIKGTVLNLQTYTMSVNRMLLESNEMFSSTLFPTPNSSLRDIAVESATESTTSAIYSKKD
jgi:hypothetical protein